MRSGGLQLYRRLRVPCTPSTCPGLRRGRLASRGQRLLASSPRPPLSQSRAPTRPFSATARAPQTSAPAPVEPPGSLSAGERKIFGLVTVALQPVQLEVQDISGGCGSMYALDIVSARFRGLSVVQQHRLVTTVLAAEVKNWHGIRLKTRAPP